MSATEPPVFFLFGMPRSGTTWLGKIFDSHPATAYLHEPDSREPMPGVPLLLTGEEASRHTATLRSFVERLPQSRSVRVRGKLPLFRKVYRSGVVERAYRANVLMAKAVAAVTGEAPVFPMGVPELNIWKSIESPGRLPALLTLYPDARAVYIVRHPCGYVASVLRGERNARFGRATPAADDRGLYAQLLRGPAARAFGVTLDEIMSLTVEERLAWRWVLSNEHVLCHAQWPERVAFLKYEELCAAPHEKARSLLAFAGLDWSPETERFLDESTAGDDDAYYGVYREPVAAALRWQEELADEAKQRIERVTGGTRAAGLYGL